MRRLIALWLMLFAVIFVAPQPSGAGCLTLLGVGSSCGGGGAAAPTRTATDARTFTNAGGFGSNTFTSVAFNTGASDLAVVAVYGACAFDIATVTMDGHAASLTVQNATTLGTTTSIWQFSGVAITSGNVVVTDTSPGTLPCTTMIIGAGRMTSVNTTATSTDNKPRTIESPGTLNVTTVNNTNGITVYAGVDAAVGPNNDSTTNVSLDSTTNSTANTSTLYFGHNNTVGSQTMGLTPATGSFLEAVAASWGP